MRNKQPKKPWAEQVREEKMEQERIKKEDEKARQARKAKMAREKKEAKRQQEIEERKRKRMPLVDVHPSQDTIARFVRRDPAAIKKNAEDSKANLHSVAEGDDESDTEDSDEGERRNKRRRTTHDTSQEEPARRKTSDLQGNAQLEDAVTRAENNSHGNLQTKCGAADAITNTNEGDQNAGKPIPAQIKDAPPTKRPSPNPVPVAEPAKQSDVSHTKQSVTKLDIPRQESPRPQAKPTLASHEGPSRPKEAPTNACNQAASKKPKRPISFSTAQPLNLPKDESTTIPQVPPRQGPVASENIKPGPSVIPVQMPKLPVNHQSGRPSVVFTPTANRTPLQNATNRISAPASKTSQSIKPLPFKGTGTGPGRPSPLSSKPNQLVARTDGGKVQKPRSPPRQSRPSVTFPARRTSSALEKNNNTTPQAASALPPSTQMFVLNNLDSIFPSPSQEALELLDELPSGPVLSSKKPRQLPPVPVFRPSAPRPALPGRKFQHTGGTALQERSLHQQVTNPNKVVQPMGPPPKPKPKDMPKEKVAEDASVMPFFSTQDFVLSSQDIRELDTPSKLANSAVGPRENNKPPNHAPAFSRHIPKQPRANDRRDYKQDHNNKEHSPSVPRDILGQVSVQSDTVPAAHKRTLSVQQERNHRSPLPKIPDGPYQKSKASALATKNQVPGQVNQQASSPRAGSQQGSYPHSQFLARGSARKQSQDIDDIEDWDDEELLALPLPQVKPTSQIGATSGSAHGLESGVKRSPVSEARSLRPTPGTQLASSIDAGTPCPPTRRHRHPHPKDPSLAGESAASPSAKRQAPSSRPAQGHVEKPSLTVAPSPRGSPRPDINQIKTVEQPAPSLTSSMNNTQTLLALQQSKMTFAEEERKRAEQRERERRMIEDPEGFAREEAERQEAERKRREEQKRANEAHMERLRKMYAKGKPTHGKIRMNNGTVLINGNIDRSDLWKEADKQAAKVTGGAKPVARAEQNSSTTGSVPGPNTVRPSKPTPPTTTGTPASGLGKPRRALTSAAPSRPGSEHGTAPKAGMATSASNSTLRTAPAPGGGKPPVPKYVGRVTEDGTLIVGDKHYEPWVLLARQLPVRRRPGGRGADRARPAGHTGQGSSLRTTTSRPAVAVSNRFQAPPAPVQHRHVDATKAVSHGDQLITASQLEELLPEITDSQIDELLPEPTTSPPHEELLPDVTASQLEELFSDSDLEDF